MKRARAAGRFVAQWRGSKQGEENLMFDKISRSWSLAGQCWAVLKEDPELLVFPLFSSLAMIVLLASFAWPVWTIYHGLDPVGTAGSTTHTARLMFYLVLGIFYVINYTVMFFFNTALIAVALRRLDGEPAGVGDGIQCALNNLSSIVAYAVIAATIGGILRAIEERVGLIGRIVVALVGAAWTLASSLTLPVLAAESVGPIEAISRSIELMRGTWGENIVGNGGISAGVAVIAIPLVIVGFFVMSAAIATKQVGLIALAGLVFVVLVFGLGLVSTTLHSIYTAALYRFATGDDHNAGIDRALLAEAYRLK
jgi:hypothetical protein